MYYSDFDKIEIDEFVGTRFGKENQLEVIGWSGKRYDSFGKSKKLYIVKCQVCLLDAELFGDGLFSTTKTNIVSAQTPCGCSKKPIWTKEQLEIRLKRKAESQGYIFRKLLDPYKKATTKILATCPIHGDWYNMNANAFLSGQQCPGCANEERVRKLSQHNSFEDSEFISAFLASGKFNLQTVFSRSDRKQSNGKTNYWKYTCLDCGLECETLATHLKMGQKSCDCAAHKQKQAYVRILKDGQTPIAIKYGIATNTQSRWYRECKLDIEEHSVWEFSDRVSCLKAERFCDETLQTRVVDRQLMPDGFTETTYINNLDKIIEIYKSFGGIQMEV